MDYESIYDSIATRLNMKNCNIFRYTITCSPQTLKQRIEGDTVQAGRDFDKSMERISRFDSMDTVKINNDNMTAYETAVYIKNMVYSE